jgi:hypothetical protein
MPLKLCRSGLGAGIDNYRPNYDVYSGELDPRGAREPALVLVASRQWSDDALGQGGDSSGAKAQFQKSWAAWKAWAKLEDVD